MSQTSYQELTYCRSLWGFNWILLFTPRVVKKRDSSPFSSWGNNCFPKSQESILKLSIAKTGFVKALHVILHLPGISGVFRGLVDSSLSNCFISSTFVLAHDLKTQPISSLSLSLIDSTINNLVSQIINLPIKFDCSLSYLWEFFVTTLDDSWEVILGLD